MWRKKHKLPPMLLLVFDSAGLLAEVGMLNVLFTGLAGFANILSSSSLLLAAPVQKVIHE